MANIVAIVGRPNVGKSTLFNRLVEERLAITDDQPGVTRDRHYGYAEWNGKHFTVIDTGGYVVGSEDVFEEAIRIQVKEALGEASVVLFVVDCKDGLTDLDTDFSLILRSVGKPIYVVANKADNYNMSLHASEFYALGIETEMFVISAASGSGTGELLDKVVSHFESSDDENTDNETPKIAILGRPNAGKSSFLNALIGTERSIVTEIAGTTRDPVHTHYKLYGKNFILTDTAGIRKKAKVKEDVEFYSVLRSIQALQNSDVCMVLIDATRGLEAQDLSIINLAHKYHKGLLMMINKWDLIAKDSKTADKIKKEYAERLGALDYIPMIFTSVTEKQRIFQAIELALEVFENRNKKVPTSQLNSKLLPEIEKFPPPSHRGKMIRIKYITQLQGRVPTFAFFCNQPKYIQPNYEKYLNNRIREHFGFTGVPIKIIFKEK